MEEKIFEVVTMAFSLTPENKLIFILTLYPGFSLNVTVTFMCFLSIFYIDYFICNYSNGSFNPFFLICNPWFPFFALH